jgi:hypothetical protein
LFYAVMGRLSYDSKPKPEYRAAREVGLWIAAAQQANLGGSEYVASAAEAAHDRQEHIASAKFTPSEIAERLDASAAQIEPAANEDMRLLASLAREQAARLRSAGDLPVFARGARPGPSAWTHTPPASAPSEKPLTLTLQIAQAKTVSAVRLHYRPTDPAAATQALEMAVKPEVSFTIPASEITGNWDMQYFFEILHADGSGWFEPDPLTTTPYWVVHIIAPHVGRN